VSPGIGELCPSHSPLHWLITFTDYVQIHAWTSPDPIWYIYLLQERRQALPAWPLEKPEEFGFER